MNILLMQFTMLKVNYPVKEALLNWLGVNLFNFSIVQSRYDFTMM